MERVQASVPEPLKKRVEKFKDACNYGTEAAAVRALLRHGLSQNSGVTTGDLDATIDYPHTKEEAPDDG